MVLPQIVKLGDSMTSRNSIQTLIIDDILERFSIIPENLSKRIKSIDDVGVLKKIYSCIIECSSIEDVSNILLNRSDSFWKNALKYKQNYDAVIKWIAQQFKGKTLDIFGIESAPIVDVFTYEPVEIKIQTSRLDLIFRDVNGHFFHCEEQRNITSDDFYRFCIYHFQAARKFGHNITDILLISGRPYNGPVTIRTNSGFYQPVIIDCSQKNGHERLEEIKQEIKTGNYSRLIELIFLPLYGKEKKDDRSYLAQKVIRFEIDLLKQDKTYENLVFATLIMCNKIIDRQLLKEYYEEVKNMLDILEIAREDGMQQGMQKGMLQEAKDTLIEILEEKIGVVPGRIIEKIKTIHTKEPLKGLLRQAVKCNDLQHFEGQLNLALN